MKQKKIIKNAKIIKIGCSYGFTVPAAFVKNGVLNLKDRYTIYLEKNKPK